MLRSIIKRVVKNKKLRKIMGKIFKSKQFRNIIRKVMKNKHVQKLIKLQKKWKNKLQKFQMKLKKSIQKINTLKSLVRKFKDRTFIKNQIKNMISKFKQVHKIMAIKMKATLNKLGKRLGSESKKLFGKLVQYGKQKINYAIDHPFQMGSKVVASYIGSKVGSAVGVAVTGASWGNPVLGAIAGFAASQATSRLVEWGLSKPAAMGDNWWQKHHYNDKVKDFGRKTLDTVKKSVNGAFKNIRFPKLKLPRNQQR